ncbi:MAG: F0F1 ATP synthase subunit delta [Sphingomonadaceae bacterium]|nr:F0F1 ATP synthase subunit delta [Sphingomonadaceae bacterium]
METSGVLGGGIEASLGGRYALALFELANEHGQLDAVSQSLAALRDALAQSEDFRRLTTSPLVCREDAVKAVDGVAIAMRLDPLTTNFLGVLAHNRRLSQLGPAIRAFQTLLARHRGQDSAEVVSAHPLDQDQVEALKTKLRQRLGREVQVDLSVDPAILGGLIVKLGSQQIDGSIRTKLNSLALAMRG